MAFLHPAVGELLENGTATAVVTPAAAVTSMPALTAAPSVAAPTKTEFDKVVADLAAARTTINNLLGVLRTAGLLTP